MRDSKFYRDCLIREQHHNALYILPETPLYPCDKY